MRIDLKPAEKLALENLTLRELLAAERHERAKERKLDYCKALFTLYDVSGNIIIGEDGSYIEVATPEEFAEKAKG